MTKLSELYNSPRIKSFLVSMVVFGVAAGIYTGVLNNYLYEVLNVNRMERGILELPRELPGLLLFIIFGLLYRFSEARIVRAAFLVSFAGVAGMVFFGSNRFVAIVMIVLWSTGEHMMMPLRQSIALHASKPGKEGLAMGGVASATNIGQVAGNYLVPLLLLLFPLFIANRGAFTYFRIFFVISSVVVFAGFIFASRVVDKSEHVQRRKLYLHRKYTKYYILEVFFGARKQVFLTFAPYVLILNYGAKTELMSALYGIYSVGTILLNPVLGRLLDKIGYKKVIVADTVILVALCFLYGFSHHFMGHKAAFIVICAVFVLDALLFTVGMARAMYVRELSDTPEETTSTLSTGLSINHLVSIVIAILGGVIWESLGIEMLFSIAAFFGLGSFFFSLTLPRPDSPGRLPVNPMPK